MKIVKKIMSMCLAMAMIVTMFAVNTMEVKAEEEAAGTYTISVTTNYSNCGQGCIVASIAVDKAGIYEKKIKYNDIVVDTWIFTNDDVSQSYGSSNTFDIFEGVADGSNATITAELYKDGELVATSSSISLTVAGERMENKPVLQVTGNILSWNPVDGASGYALYIYNSANKNTPVYTSECQVDLSAYSDVSRVQVKAISANYAVALDSANVWITDFSSTPSNPTDPSDPTPPPTEDSNSSNSSGNATPVYAPTEADIYEQQMKEKEAKYKKVVTGADGKEVTSSITGVYEVNTMAGTAVKTAKTDVAKAVLTEDEIQNGTNTSIYMSDGLSKEVKDSLKNVASTNGKNVLTMFMADMYKISKAGEVIKTNNLKENIEMVFGIPSYAVDANRTYSVLCVTPDGRVIEFKDIDNDPKTITLNVNVMGNYVIVY